MTQRFIGRRTVLGGLLTLAIACSRLDRTASTPRVVSISPSTTEAVFAVGAGDLLVGRSTYCDEPPAAQTLPAVGGFADPSVEKILALHPTLVLSARGPAGPLLAERLQARGVSVFFPEVESIPHIESMLTELGKRLGHEQGAAAAVASIEVSRRQVAAAIAGRTRVRAVLLFDVAPIIVAGPNSFLDGLLREAGGTNVIDAGGSYPSLGLETLLTLDPDVILDGVSDAHAPQGASRVSALRGAPGWKSLRAMREGRIHALTGAALRPGPRIGQGLRVMVRALHGNVIPEAP